MENFSEGGGSSEVISASTSSAKAEMVYVSGLGELRTVAVVYGELTILRHKSNG